MPLMPVHFAHLRAPACSCVAGSVPKSDAAIAIVQEKCRTSLYLRSNNQPLDWRSSDATRAPRRAKIKSVYPWLAGTPRS